MVPEIVLKVAAVAAGEVDHWGLAVTEEDHDRDHHLAAYLEVEHTTGGTAEGEGVDVVGIRKTQVLHRCQPQEHLEQVIQTVKVLKAE